MSATETDHAMANDLRRQWNQAGQYPLTRVVSREVYEAVERVIEDWIEEMDRRYPLELHTLWCGPHGGIMFKNVELVIGTGQPATSGQGGGMIQ